MLTPLRLGGLIAPLAGGKGERGPFSQQLPPWRFLICFSLHGTQVLLLCRERSNARVPDSTFFYERKTPSVK